MCIHRVICASLISITVLLMTLVMQVIESRLFYTFISNGCNRIKGLMAYGLKHTITKRLVWWLHANLNAIVKRKGLNIACSMYAVMSL